MLDCLTPRQRLAVLSRMEGRTRAETARRHGITAKRVKNLLNEARRRLRASYPALAGVTCAAETARAECPAMSLSAVRQF